MRGLIIFSVLTWTLLSCQNAKPELITREDVDDLLAKWEGAYLTRDTQALDEVLHSQWQYSGSADGTVSTKAQAIKELETADYQFLSQDFSEMDVQYFENVAVIRGRELLKMLLASGDTLSLSLRFTDVYRKERGITRAIATHSSPIVD